jgi:hypothetical protein
MLAHTALPTQAFHFQRWFYGYYLIAIGLMIACTAPVMHQGQSGPGLHGSSRLKSGKSLRQRKSRRQYRGPR